MADGLTDHGWIVHRIADLFSNDAQEVPDEVWLAAAASNGWVGLTQDASLWKLCPSPLPVFCLADGNLGVAAKIEWLLAAEGQIMRLAVKYTPGLWMVKEPPKPVAIRYRG